MKVIMIGTDRKLFEADSAVRRRMLEYSEPLQELHVIVFAKSDLKLKAAQISDKVWIYPTNSLSRLLYIFDAVRIGKTIVENRYITPSELLISTQDPFETGRAGMALRNHFKAKIQIQIHTDFLDPHFAKGSFLNRLRVRMAKRLLPNANGIRAVSGRIARSLSYLGIPQSNVGILPIYTYPAIFEAAPVKNLKDMYPQFSFIILMVSRLAKEKNIPLALRVFAEVLKSYPRTGMVILGDGPAKPKIQALAMKLGIAGSVVFEPWQNELVSYYKTCGAFLSASNYEGYGLTLIEAGLSGTPIITTDVGVASEIFRDGENAFVCPVGDKECLTAKLSELVGNPARSEQFKAQVTTDVRHAIIADKVRHLERYQALLEKAWHS